MRHRSERVLHYERAAAFLQAPLHRVSHDVEGGCYGYVYHDAVGVGAAYRRHGRLRERVEPGVIEVLQRCRALSVRQARPSRREVVVFRVASGGIDKSDESHGLHRAVRLLLPHVRQLIEVEQRLDSRPHRRRSGRIAALRRGAGEEPGDIARIESAALPGHYLQEAAVLCYVCRIRCCHIFCFFIVILPVSRPRRPLAGRPRRCPAPSRRPTRCPLPPPTC